MLGGQRLSKQLPDDVALAWASASFIGTSEMRDEANEHFIEVTQPNRQQRFAYDVPRHARDVPGLVDHRYARGSRGAARVVVHRGKKVRTEGAMRSRSAR